MPGRRGTAYAARPEIFPCAADCSPNASLRCGWMPVTSQSVSLLPQFEHGEAQLDQRHVAAAGVHQSLQIGLALMAARLVPDQHAGVVGARCRARRRRAVRVRLFRHCWRCIQVSVRRKTTAQSALLLPFGHQIARLRRQKGRADHRKPHGQQRHGHRPGITGELRSPRRSRPRGPAPKRSGGRL
jgi:hypothetical protein